MWVDRSSVTNFFGLPVEVAVGEAVSFSSADDIHTEELY